MDRDYASAIANNDILKIEQYILESTGLVQNIFGNLGNSFQVDENGKFSNFVVSLGDEKRFYICESFYNLANQEQRNCNYAFACELYKRALSYYFYPSALGNLATTYKLMKQYKLCIETIDELLEKSPDYKQGYLRLIKFALAYNVKPKYPINNYFNLYFQNGGSESQVSFFIEDQQAQIVERNELKKAYESYKKSNNGLIKKILSFWK